MGRIEPLAREDLPEYEPVFELIEASMGFVPSSLPTMARIPALFDAFAGLASTVMSADHIDAVLGQLVAHMASTAAGCRYCQAHTAAHAGHAVLLADTRQTGRPRGAHDLIIAATAKSAGRAVVSADPSGFEDLPGVDLHRHR